MKNLRSGVYPECNEGAVPQDDNLMPGIPALEHDHIVTVDQFRLCYIAQNFLDVLTGLSHQLFDLIRRRTLTVDYSQISYE